MRRFLSILTVLCFLILGASAQEQPLVRQEMSQSEISRIVKTFTDKEGQFRDSLRDYVFSRDATIQTIGLGGNITGEYKRVSDLTFNSDGTRFEKIKFAPIPTLKDINVTAEDLEDLGGVNPFALDPSAVNLYNFNYVGKQKIDEVDLFVFDVTPKVIPDPKKTKQRLFTGRVWVDDRALQIVKSKGKAVPETKENKYPIVETWRDQVDGKFWFPVYSYANDELVFGSGQVVRIRMIVKYSDYKLGRTDVRVLDDPGDTSETTTTSPTQKKP